METVQIVLDRALLKAADRAARSNKQSRSALVQEALREYLTKLEVHTKEQRDREGYARQPQTGDESHLWEAEASLPADSEVL